MIAVRTVAGLSFACMLAVSTGCYTYAPATIETVPTGSRVRVMVSTEAFLRLQDQNNVDQPVFEGVLEGVTGRDVIISIPLVEMARNFGGRTLYQRITIEPRDILRVDRRKTDTARTGALLAALVGTATYLIIDNFFSTPPGTFPPPPPGGQEHRTGWTVNVSVPIP